MSPTPVTTPAAAGRPPAAARGTAASYNGRLIVSGVGSFLRPVSPRASIADLWATLDIAAASGVTALQRKGGPKLDKAAQARLSAYVQQARQYYEAVFQADPIAKPLLGYYFVLNAAKAYLTAAAPTLTEPVGFSHGIGQQNSFLRDPYDFSQERLEIMQRSGVFQALAGRTGRRHIWTAGNMEISKLLPYLVESVDLFSTTFQKAPALIPISQISVEMEGTRPHKRMWMTIQVSRMALLEADLSPKKLLSVAAGFENSFKLVDASWNADATYQSKVAIAYSAMPAPIPDLQQAFDDSLIVRNRSSNVSRDWVVKSPYLNLISSEALTFAVMIHLSNMVRYRPHHVEQLRGGPYWWLFTSWVDRAVENFLLSISSRISLEEHLIM
jgi:hypothetical protein